MKTPDLLELAARNLRESMLRNSLTTLGIGVGVASLVAMLSLGVGLQQLATRRLEKTGLFDTVIVTRRDLGGFGARRRAAATSDDNRVLNEDARREISNIPGVLEAVPDLRMMTQMRLDDKTHRAMVAALPMSARDREAFESIQGKFFSSGNAAEVIVQSHFAEELMGLTPSQDEITNSSGPKTPESRELVSQMTESKSFAPSGSYLSINNLSRDIANGKLNAGLVIPYDYARDLHRGRPVTVQVLLNAMNSNTATIAQAYAQGVIATYGQGLVAQGLHAQFRQIAAPDVNSKGQVLLHPDYLYNPGPEPT